jgi:hypothetical protein
MSKRLKYDDDEEDEEDTEEIITFSFNKIHEDISHNTKFCWGCDHTLRSGTKNPFIQLMYDAIKDKRPLMSQYQLAEHVSKLKYKHFPDDGEEFTPAQVLIHMNHHMFDISTELFLQIEKCCTKEKLLENHIYLKRGGKFELDHECIKSLEIVTNKKIALLEKLNKIKKDF